MKASLKALVRKGLGWLVKEIKEELNDEIDRRVERRLSGVGAGAEKPASPGTGGLGR